MRVNGVPLDPLMQWSASLKCYYLKLQRCETGDLIGLFAPNFVILIQKKYSACFHAVFCKTMQNNMLAYLQGSVPSWICHWIRLDFYFNWPYSTFILAIINLHSSCFLNLVNQGPCGHAFELSVEHPTETISWSEMYGIEDCCWIASLESSIEEVCALAFLDAPRKSLDFNLLGFP